MSSKMMDTKIQLPVERIRFFARGLVVFKPQTTTVQTVGDARIVLRRIRCRHPNREQSKPLWWMPRAL